VLNTTAQYNEESWERILQAQNSKVAESMAQMLKLSSLVKTTRSEIQLERKARGILKVRKCPTSGTIRADLQVAPKYDH